ncbi:CapA family protein [Paramuribaculum intestinale]|uniref:CapA family protein n=1 Tax=Paramuribaculum intestinale TaxID=2094151 RepID=UPI002620B3DE|nr:CapA family protein [Paramuribaculum intestinale]
MIGLLVSLAWLLCAPQEAELLFVGDAMMHQRQIDAALQPDGTHSFDACFDSIRRWVSEADYAVANLEAPLGGEPYTGYPMFSAPDSYAQALRDAGFDLTLTANNHCLDRRDRGLQRTIAVLDSLAMPHIGTYSPASVRDSLALHIADVNGFRIGFLNYTYGTNGIRHGAAVAVDPIDVSLIEADIARARSRGVELVAVCIHWGVEYRMLPEQSQRDTGSRIHRAGADMVIGSHPHVIQPAEMAADSAGRRHLTVYSLGNFLSAMRTPDTRGGAAVSVTLRRDRLGRPYIDRAESHLLFTVTPSRPGEPFRVVRADRPIHDDPEAEEQRIEFARRAAEILRQHNKNVKAP